ncbi:XdhC family protein [Anaeroselena agilis]|uniref:XdhC family protein n=1 Tax=Anaeroselena agilis TaxID=3063788 RepID=A0ABU3P0N5_9FIRM|nr:XdhC family protein [Selenomonadales bacterium 4137-cl]
MDEVLRALSTARANGDRVALVTIITTRGSTPRKAGTKMVVSADGRVSGTIGGGCAEAEVRLKALQVLDDGRPVLYQVNLLNDVAAADGMVCGGVMEVFIQPA